MDYSGLTRFLRSPKKIAIYATIKLSIVIWSFYNFIQIGNKDFFRAIIFLGFACFLLISMMPIMILHQFEMRKKRIEDKQKAEQAIDGKY